MFTKNLISALKRVAGLWVSAAAAVLAAVALAACGGGGSGDAAVTGVTATTTTGVVERGPAPVPAPAPAPAPAPVPPAPVAPPPLSPADAALSPRERLGKLIFTDTNLSEPRGTACIACHAPGQGFASGNGSPSGVALGSAGTLGLRNPMTNAYSGYIPGFGFRQDGDVYEAFGGHFWDGRADTLALQALGPFLNPKEMNNPSAKAVMDKIAAAGYANLFRQEFGASVFTNVDTAYTQVGVAIEAFEKSAQMQSFSSKFDAVARGQAQFSAPEARGLAIFTDAKRANCAGCHAVNVTSKNPEDSLFSEFSYYNTGVPRNRAIPANADPAFFDLGLCGPERGKPTLPADAPAGTQIESYCGKFRMPTLRNAALRQAFMHNGQFKSLREVVEFYSTRISDPQRWYGPSGVPNDLPAAYLGNIEAVKPPFNRKRSDGPVLTEPEITDLLAFLRTLTDTAIAP